ncbi:hypothetical protein MMC31_000141 [Peltigera leucophlebia]|nr:hypothetical protein [Peltigera leucophlebia]
MEPVPQETLNWLYGILRSVPHFQCDKDQEYQSYRDIDRTYADVTQALSQNPTISPRTDVYTYEHGQSVLLLNLSGTLPVNFRGTTYMFPLSIWIPHEYPRAVPIQFVTPTRNMAVRPGQYISGEGRIYHPYLAGWREDRSTISEFLLILREVFAREPPVVSKQEKISQPPPPPRPRVIPPSVPPLPPELGNSEDRRAQSPISPRSTPRPPQLPPKPFAALGQVQITTNDVPSRVPLHIGRTEIYHPSPFQDYAGAGAPIHSIPAQRGGILKNELMPRPTHYQPTYQSLDQRRDSYSPVSPLTPPRQPLELPSSSTRLSQGPSFFQGPPPPQLPPATVEPMFAGHPWTGYKAPNLSKIVYSQQSDPHFGLQHQQPPKRRPVEDLLTSASENTVPAANANSPPPIPPNPQKDALLSALSQTLTQQAHKSYASHFAAIPPLQAQQTAMHTTLAAMNQEISQLNNLESVLSSNEAILHRAMRDAEKVMEDARHRKVPSVDEVLVAPTVVAGQLYELVADEHSLEECRAVVAKALDRGRMGGDIWAKQTRSLAREEFLKKALIRKVASGMGLVNNLRWDKRS